METRKIQQVSGGTYTVSIPKEWATEHGLEAGMEVRLYTHRDGTLVLRKSAADGDGFEAARISVDGTDPVLVERALRAANAIGFETISLVPTESFTEEQRVVARQAVRGLVGTELLIEADDEIRIQNLLDASDVSIRQTVVQLHTLALTIHRRGTDAFVDGIESEPERLAERVEEAGRLADMVTRHFNRSLVSLGEVDRLAVSRVELFDHHAVARELVRVAELGARIARLDGKPSSGTSEEEAAAIVNENSVAAREIVDEATAAFLEGAEPGPLPSDPWSDRPRRDLTEPRPSGLPADQTSTVDHLSVTGALDAIERTAMAGDAIAAIATRAAIRQTHL